MRTLLRGMVATLASLAVAADIPPVGQGYPIHGLYKTCSAA